MFTLKDLLLIPREKVNFLCDFWGIFGPPKCQWAIKSESCVKTCQLFFKHIPYDLNISSKIKKRVLGTIEIWRKSPSTEALWGGRSRAVLIFSPKIHPFRRTKACLRDASMDHFGWIFGEKKSLQIFSVILRGKTMNFRKKGGRNDEFSEKRGGSLQSEKFRWF